MPKDYNPVTHPWCNDCENYYPVAQWIFQIEREPDRMAKCRFLSICYRAVKAAMPKQLTINDLLEEATP
jgi:hypothetical protein